jgi:hypothetical protein
MKNPTVTIKDLAATLERPPEPLPASSVVSLWGARPPDDDLDDETIDAPAATEETQDEKAPEKDTQSDTPRLSTAARTRADGRTGASHDEPAAMPGERTIPDERPSLADSPQTNDDSKLLLQETDKDDPDDGLDADIELPGTSRGENHRSITLSMPGETRELLERAAEDDTRGAAAMDAMRASYEYLFALRIVRPEPQGPFPAAPRRVARRRRNQRSLGNVSVSVTNAEAAVLGQLRDQTGRSMSELFTLAVEHYWRPLLGDD